MRWGLSLAAVALPKVGDCICSHGWLILTLRMGLVSQSSTTLMVSSYSFIEFCQYILPLLTGETIEILPV